MSSKVSIGGYKKTFFHISTIQLKDYSVGMEKMMKHYSLSNKSKECNPFIVFYNPKEVVKHE